MGPITKVDNKLSSKRVITRSLLRDMTISLFSVVLVVSLSITGLNYWSFSKKASRSYQLKAAEYLSYLQESLEPPLWHMRDELVRRIGMSLSKNEIVSKLIIKDHTGKVLFRKEKMEEVAIVEQEGPVFHGEEKIGSVLIGVSRQPFIESNRILIRTNIVAMISVGLTLMGMAWLLLKLFLMNPLKYLNERILLIAEGKYQFELRQAKQREINDIILKFNEMALQVKKRERSLLVANEKLEKEVRDRKENEMQLRRLFTAVEYAADNIIISDTDGHIQYANPAVEKTSGFRRDQLMGKNFLSWKSGEDPSKRHREIRVTLEAGNVWSGLTWKERKDGSVYQQEETISPILRGSGTIIGYVSVGRDVTEKEKLKEQLKQAERMEAIGTLAGGIAHDFNNILHGILGNAGVAKTHELPEGHPAVYSLDQIIKASERASDLVNQILTFSRQKEPLLSEMNLHPIIKEVVKLLRASLPATIDIQLFLKARTDHIVGSPSGIYRILMNLCTNAAQSMAPNKGGTLTIGTRNREIRESERQFYDEVKAGAYIELSVRDTGEGIPRLVKDRIFEPYFTTKPLGEGSGLGLSVIHGVVKGFSGHIDVESTPGEGCQFTVLLPLVDERLPIKRAYECAIPEGTETILFVDDEELVTDMGKRMLEGLGYTVTVTNSSATALRLFSEANPAYDLVMTDMTMPVMTGERLAAEILAMDPVVPVILFTGYSEMIDKKKAAQIGIRATVMKPILIEQMAQTVRRVLDEKQS